jgi:protein KRI1
MKAKLLDDGSSEDDFDESGGVALQEHRPEDHGFKINEVYAKRFEHNKKREELHRRMYRAIKWLRRFAN